MLRCLLPLIAALFCLSLFAQRGEQPTVRLNHLALQVASLPRSAAFYAQTIGIDSMPEPFRDGKHAWFRIGGGAQLHLIETDSLPVVPGKHTHLCFTVASVPAFAEKLRGRGIAWEDWPGKPFAITTRVDGVKQLYLRDPDGYWIEINDDRSGQQP